MKKIQTALVVVAALAPAAFVAVEALAYTVGTATTGANAQFDTFLAVVIEWLEGPLGTLLAVIALGIGLGLGVMQQSVMAVVIGLFFAAIVNYGPSILQGVSGAATTAI